MWKLRRGSKVLSVRQFVPGERWVARNGAHVTIECITSAKQGFALQVIFGVPCRQFFSSCRRYKLLQRYSVGDSCGFDTLLRESGKLIVNALMALLELKQEILSAKLLEFPIVRSLGNLRDYELQCSEFRRRMPILKPYRHSHLSRTDATRKIFPDAPISTREIEGIQSRLRQFFPEPNFDRESRLLAIRNTSLPKGLVLARRWR